MNVEVIWLLVLFGWLLVGIAMVAGHHWLRTRHPARCICCGGTHPREP